MYNNVRFQAGFEFGVKCASVGKLAIIIENCEKLGWCDNVRGLRMALNYRLGL